MLNGGVDVRVAGADKDVFPYLSFNLGFDSLSPVCLRIHSCAEGCLVCNRTGHAECDEALLRNVFDAVGELIVKQRETHPAAAVEQQLIDAAIVCSGVLRPDRSYVVLRDQLTTGG